MHKILLIEDNEMNRDMLSRRLTRKGFEIAITMLEKRGHTVDLATTGVAAVTMAREHDYDIVLMDLEMPEMGGLEATERIRALPGLAEIPIVALTAHAMSGDREKCLEAGCDEYETKPVDLPRLLDKIEKLLVGESNESPRGPADS